MNDGRITAWLGILLLTGTLTACSRDKPLTCDEPQRYQASQTGQRIVAPEGLDNIDARAELAIPEVSPREPRPEGSPCLERPPAYVSPDR